MTKKNSSRIGPLSPPAGEFVGSLSGALQLVLDDYRAAISEPFANHSLGVLIRRDLKMLLARSLGSAGLGMLIKGSCGQGRWANAPWVAIFDPILTSTAQSQYYVCFLFREDMKGVYLTLVQAMTEAKILYKADAKTALKARAANFRALLGKSLNAFPLTDIDLAPTSPGNDSVFYEAGVICAQFYPADQIPNDATLELNLSGMMAIYAELISIETNLPLAGEDTSEIEQSRESEYFEDRSRKRLHFRIERNRKLADEVKKQKGTTCEACGINFSDIYGNLGEGYIEAHHLKPVSTLTEVRTALDPWKDFAVLCSNCHRMIHRSEHVDDVEEFRRLHLLRT